MSEKGKLTRVVVTATGKICTSCGCDKPLSAFSKHKTCKLGLKSKCKKCCGDELRARRAAMTPEQRAARSAKGSQWFRDNPDYRRNNHLQRKFGITLADYQSMLARQGGMCLICGCTDSRDPRFDTFHVDHDHTTGEVRGLLCSSCNKGIGLLADDPNRLMAAAAYLLSRSDVLECAS